MDRERRSLNYEPADDSDTAVIEVEECLICDDRGGLTPSEQVERKLVEMLHSTSVRVSQLQSGKEKRSLS